jgi:hypothetical protein
LPAIEKQHDCGSGGDNFGEGSRVEDGVLGHWLDWIDAALAVSAMVGSAVVLDPQNSAGEFVRSDGRSDGGVHFSEPGWIETGWSSLRGCKSRLRRGAGRKKGKSNRGEK